jgi:hypothetical protein
LGKIPDSDPVLDGEAIYKRKPVRRSDKLYEFVERGAFSIPLYLASNAETPM